MKITLQALAFSQKIDGTNQFSAKIYIRVILGILFLGHYSSAKMLYATR